MNTSMEHVYCPPSTAPCGIFPKLACLLLALFASIGWAQGQVPTITSFSPLSAKPGDAVTVTGTNFNTTAANNVVFMGATRATVTAASATSLMVTVPAGATYAPITVLNTASGLAAYSNQFFTPIYTPAKSNITTDDFAPKVDYATGTTPYWVAIGDLDGDGRADLAVTNYFGTTLSVLRNNGDGTFAAKVDFVTGINPYAVVIGDLDGDGKPELTVASAGNNAVSVLRNTANSGAITSDSFAAKVDFITGEFPCSVAIGDLDGDGKPDLATANYFGNTISVLRNTGGSGSIAFAAKEDFITGSLPNSVAIGDLDGDGRPDLVTANRFWDSRRRTSSTVSVLHNTATSGNISSSSFAPKVDFSTGFGSYWVSIGDLDGDGRSDLTVANSNSNNISVLHNTATIGSISSSSFAPKVDFATGSHPSSVAIGDLNGDGMPDLAVSNYLSNTVSVLQNTASSGNITNGSFALKVDFTTDSGPFSVAIGDLNGDGMPDLATANQTLNTVSVMLQVPPPTTVWNGTAWSNGTGPTASLDAVIASVSPNPPLSSFTSRNLTVNTGVNWVVANGVTVTINGTLNYSGNITVQSGGSLVQTEGSTLGTTTGTFRAQRSVSNPALPGTSTTFAYNYWGSPVQDQAASVLNASSFRRRYTFHEPSGQWRNSDNTMTSLISVAGEAKFYTNFTGGVHRLVPGVGYTSAVNQTSFTREFTGTPNNGNLTVNTSRLSAGSFAGYNFVGNPYASALLIADNDAGTTGLLEDALNSDFEASAYVFTDSEDGKGTGSYRVVNAAGAQGNHIAAAQGFFVIRKAAPVATSGNLTFRNAHRVGTNNADANFYRGEALSTEHLSLVVRRADRVSDNVALALADNFADAYENGRDAKKLDANNELNLAARWNGERLAQVAIGKKENLEIPLSLNTVRTGEHIFTSENLPTATTLPLFLEDRATGEFYYLQAGREHKINIASGRYENRFFIRTIDEVAKGAQATGTQVFSHGRELFVKANANGGTLRIFNLMGTELWKAENVQAKGLARFTVQVPSSGIYVVKYTDEQGSTEAKVWLEK